MIFGIPLFGRRVAPRCSIADSILLLRVTRNKIATKKHINLGETSWLDLLKMLLDNKVDTLVCGGINTENKELAASQGISVIDNVAGTEEEIIEAIEQKKLRPGFGLSDISFDYNESYEEDDYNYNEKIVPPDFDCLACIEKDCLAGKRCMFIENIKLPAESKEKKEMLDSAMDISLEEERKLCRLSELVYFALEMKYKKIGVAYCTDLVEPTEILVNVLRRFFKVYPVCCKIGGKNVSGNEVPIESSKIACNPQGQAEVLNNIGTDLNVIVGLCIGADCILAQASAAPVTTLFVKDKSLANNPIGAVYSDYYLREVSTTTLE